MKDWNHDWAQAPRDGTVVEVDWSGPPGIARADRVYWVDQPGHGGIGYWMIEGEGSVGPNNPNLRAWRATGELPLTPAELGARARARVEELRAAVYP